MLTLQQIVQRGVACAERVADLYSGPADKCEDIRYAINLARRFADGDSNVTPEKARSAATKAREASLATSALHHRESFYAGIAAYRTALSAEAAIIATSLEHIDDGVTYNRASLFREDAVKMAQLACEATLQAESVH